MFEAKLQQSGLFKRVIDSIKDLVTDGNWDCNESGMALQSMDSSHVTLISVLLKADGFSPYRCDRNLSLGINIGSMSKILKCASNEDTMTLSAGEDGDTLSFLFESKNERVSEYELKLMDIDADHMGIPDTDYDAVISMSSNAFGKIVRDMASISENVTVSVSKDGVKFHSTGEVGSGTVYLKQNVAVDAEEEGLTIVMQQPVSLSFSLKYLSMFAKAGVLSNKVVLHLHPEAPLLVEYKIEEVGYLRFYLAPKIGEDEEM